MATPKNQRGRAQLQRQKTLKCTCGNIAHLKFGGCRTKIKHVVVTIQITPYYWCTGCGIKFMTCSDSISYKKSVQMAAAKLHLESTYFISTPNLVENSNNQKRYVRNVDDSYWHIESGESDEG